MDEKVREGGKDRRVGEVGGRRREEKVRRVEGEGWRPTMKE